MACNPVVQCLWSFMHTAHAYCFRPIMNACRSSWAGWLPCLIAYSLLCRRMASGGCETHAHEQPDSWGGSRANQTDTRCQDNYWGHHISAVPAGEYRCIHKPVNSVHACGEIWTLLCRSLICSCLCLCLLQAIWTINARHSVHHSSYLLSVFIKAFRPCECGKALLQVCRLLCHAKMLSRIHLHCRHWRSWQEAA